MFITIKCFLCVVDQSKITVAFGMHSNKSSSVKSISLVKTGKLAAVTKLFIVCILKSNWIRRT